jgi:hemerythrin
MEERGWNPDMALGIPLFDEAHQALAEQIDALMDASDADFLEGLQQLIECLEEDFRHEEALMKPSTIRPSSSIANSMRACWPACTSSMKRISRRQGSRKLVLPWFHAHLATADTALARALQAGAA